MLRLAKRIASSTLNAAAALRNELVHRYWCVKYACCQPDWYEKIDGNLPLPLCHNCHKPVPSAPAGHAGQAQRRDWALTAIFVVHGWTLVAWRRVCRDGSESPNVGALPLK